MFEFVLQILGTEEKDSTKNVKDAYRVMFSK